MFTKTLVTIITAITVLIAISFLFFKNEIPTSEHPIAKLEQKIIYINGHQLTVEVADEVNEQTQGLSERKSLEENSGMLFIFKSSVVPAFWMKNMNFPIDIIWLDANKMIIAITKNVSPDTFPQTFQPQLPVLYVLEVPANWSDRNNIKTGNIVTFVPY